MIFFEPENRDKNLLFYDVFKAVIAPRPIGWISTVSKKNELNLAPYSWFNGFCSNPKIIGFSSEGEKDSLSFAKETMEFTWNLVSYDLRKKMNLSATELKRGDNEFNYAGLSISKSKIVKPPRVKESLVSFECKLTQIVNLVDKNKKKTEATLVLGEVVGIHLDKKLINNGKIDISRAKPLARCGYNEYTYVMKTFEMKRP